MLRHIVFTQGRSGSNFLVRTLNSHPEVVNYGEVFSDWTPLSKLRQLMNTVGFTNVDYLEFLYDSKTIYNCAQLWNLCARTRNGKSRNFKLLKNTKTLGIKEFGIHFDKFEAQEFLLKNPDISIIYLFRENIIQRYLSLVSLGRRGVISTESSRVSADKMYIDIDEALVRLEDLSRKRQYEQSLIDSLNGNPILPLRYEDAYVNSQTLRYMMEQVFEFLNVPPIDTMSTHRKILPRKIKDIVENSDEFIEAISSTRYAKYLD